MVIRCSVKNIPSTIGKFGRLKKYLKRAVRFDRMVVILHGDFEKVKNSGLLFAAAFNLQR
ncbi:hypothetical protein DCCM_2548 [Desulfocucumis palustris]|uniref:Uncharacterized protein n=1 Tax=Desulfocucumis palustris TaxID=1898651 RepID=A0A2L2XAY7_9FIRM|nr:hypothetical protein DCCM_2548 [Desulfocucumis palustris]